MIGHITNLDTAKIVVLPGPACKLCTIQNNGTVDVWLSFDGGTSMLNGTGTLPTAGTGYKLAAGSQFVMTLSQYPSISPRPIWGISAGGAVVIDVATDDKDSTCPNHA